MKFFNLLVLSALSTTLLISCDTKRSPYVGDEDAQFFIGSVDGKTETKHRNSEKKPDQTQITFTACLKTLAGGGIPNGLSFDIQTGSEKQSSKTNQDGCITWIEIHRFNPAVYERNLRLTRTIQSRNDYAGKRSLTIYWNPRTNALANNLQNDLVPVRTEDPVENTFRMSDATLTKQSKAGEISSTDGTVSSSDGTGIPGQDVEVEGTNPNELQTRLVLSSIELTHVKLNQEAPFKVDKNLTLYSQHTYQVSAAPKYYVNTIDNPDEEVNPPGGKYKITLVFMDDPRIDLEKLSSEIAQHASVESLNKSTSIEGRQLKLAAQVLISNKELAVNGVLTAATKKQLLNKALISHVHATAQFIADKKAEQDIEKYVDIHLKKLASLDVRSVLAVTVENISTDQTQKLKGHGIGYVNNLLEPGSVTLLQSPIEADSLYNEYVTTENDKEKIKPLDLFVQASNAQLKERALAPLDKNTIPRAQLNNPMLFKTDYPFNQEFETFLNNGQTPQTRALFVRALCYKLFMLEELKPLDAKKGWFENETRNSWVQRCQMEQSFRMKYYNVQVVDFVESVDDAKVTKVGQSVKEDIKISRSFEKSDSTSQSQGHKSETSIAHQDWKMMLGNFLVDGVLAAVTVANPLAGAALTTGLNFAKEHFPISSGGSFYYSTAVESSQSTSEGISREISQAISINIDTFKINVETRRCALITYEPWVEKVMNDIHHLKLRKGFIACAAKTAKPTYYEKYYMVTQDCSEKNGTTDCTSGEENQLRMVLRGETKYKQFNEMVKNTKLSIFLDPVDSELLEQQRMKWAKMMDSIMTSQVFPGAIVPVMK